ncbi:Hypothetical protein PHPALM_1772 [Phytophthora palmivora]|uniref:MULE transposase domain-containing protein n=1 Tax=Phytophthora palmivora TaxID=4796 RepID=A0A2P4YRI2_9STRA|nr:Hypothetical protein PHPALM_1772 [Phytophthora palmivora]
MSRSSSARAKKTPQRLCYSPSSRPTTRAIRGQQDVEGHVASPQSETAHASPPSFSHQELTEAAPGQLSTTHEQTTASQHKRGGKTKIYFMGYEYTRANITSVKITYRCSFYRKRPTIDMMLVFHAATMSYDLANMVPHTCQTGGDVEGENALANDDSVCVSVEDDMKKFVDHLIEQNLSATEIWTRTFTKFYLQSTSVVRGLSRSQVQARVHKAKAGSNLLALLEDPVWARVKNELVGVFQFNYAWYDDSRAKQGKSEIERLVGWAHPELRNLLRYDGAHLFVDGTFRCTPVGCLFHFKQACRRKMKEYRLSEAEASVAMEFGVLDMLTVIAPEKIAIEGVAWVKSKIKAQCETKGLCYSQGKWKKFWQYFARTWLEMYPPELWNICGVQRKIVNRTNNPLERFHRELNARSKPHPSLKRFVRVIERIAFEYVVHRKSIISGDAVAPVRPSMRFPRAVPMPSPSEIEDSDSDNDTAEVLDNLDVPVDENQEPSDGELGIMYDTTFEYEEEIKFDESLY